MVFAPGETRKEILLQVQGDTVPELNEAMRIELNGSVEATTRGGALTVLDDDAAGITPENVTVNESDGSATVKVRLNVAQRDPVTVNYRTDWETGTADRYGSDYTPVSGTLTFAPGETRKQVVIPIRQDRVKELPEFFELVLYDASPNVIVRQRARIEIHDDGDFPDFQMADADAFEGDWAMLYLAAVPDPQTPVRVGLRTVPGTATPAIDYRVVVDDEDRDPLSTSVDRYGAYLYVGVFEDGRPEGAETFVVEVFDIDDPSRVLASATVTVKDDTSLPLVAIGDANAREGQSASFPVTLSKPSLVPVSFRIRTVADTAEANVDFEAVSQLYTFMAGETSMTVQVRTLEDSLAEPHETFSVALVSSAEARPGDVVGRGRIFDDDDPEVPVLAVANVSVAEAAGVALFTVTLQRALSRRTSVSFATADGTAVAGEDYLASYGELTFEAGETSKTLEIALVNDARFEEGETFTLRLINGPEATATILDDDTKGRTRAVRR